MKVIVYVKVADERMLEEDGHDPAEWVRAKVKELLEAKRKTKQGAD